MKNENNEINENNVLDYKYEVKRIAPSEAVIEHYSLAAEKDREVLLQQFRIMNHIPDDEKPEFLPDSFLIKTDEIRYLKTFLFENVARAEKQRFDEIQKYIDDTMIDIKNEIDKIDSTINILTEYKKESEENLKKTIIVDDKLFYENRIKTNETAIKNWESEKKEKEDALNKIVKTREKNLTIWKDKQLPMIKNGAESTISAYIKSATEYIEHQYGFTNFIFVPLDIMSLPKSIITDEE